MGDQHDQEHHAGDVEQDRRVVDERDGHQHPTAPKTRTTSTSDTDNSSAP